MQEYRVKVYFFVKENNPRVAEEMVEEMVKNMGKVAVRKGSAKLILEKETENGNKSNPR